MKIDKIRETIAEKDWRLTVVEDILSMETHPDELRRYRAEKSRLKTRLRSLNDMLKQAEQEVTK